MPSQLKLSREQLASFLKDHESIKQFENLFRVAQTVDPEGENSTAISAANDESRAALAISIISEISQALSAELATLNVSASNALSSVMIADRRLKSNGVLLWLST